MNAYRVINLRYVYKLCAMALVIVMMGVTSVSPAYARGAPDSFADLAEKLLPAVVNVSTTQTTVRAQMGLEIPQFPPGSPFEEFFKDFMDKNQGDPTPRKTTSLGSGFVIDPKGYIVTNNHVIAGAEEISVIFQDNTTLKAEIVGRDEKTDLALLKVKTSKDLPYVQWGESDESRVGDWVLAIGNPFGLGGTVTAGIISARARDINAGPYDDFIQTDASINRGNSGGPMFNTSGQVVGVNTAIFSPSGGSIGIGFAVPSSLAKPVVDQLKEFGRTKRGWLGVRIQQVTDEIAESLGLDAPKGALVASITDPSPASKAHITVGDIILRFNGQDVNEMRKLPRIVAETPIGKKAEVVLWRKGRSVTAEVEVGELEKAEEMQLIETSSNGQNPTTSGTGVDVLDMTLSPLTTVLRQQFKIGQDVMGAVITGIKAGSLAAEKGLRPGDVIVEVGQEEVGTPQDVLAKIQEAKESDKKTILLLVDRSGDLRFVALRVDGK